MQMANGTSLTTTASDGQADLEDRSGALVRPEVDQAVHRSKRFRWWLLLMVVVPVGFVAWGVWWWLVPGGGLSSQITVAVTRGTLAVHILAGGELESAKTVDVF